jgi:hypothetical protein
MSSSLATDRVTSYPEPVRHPFGLPLGSVRGMFSVLICSFFWLTLLWPGEQPIRALLGHFFMLGLVVMAFASAPVIADRERETSAFLPWILRLIFVGGSVAVVAYAALNDPNQLQRRLTPDPAEVSDWWVPFLATLSGGFGFGLLLRFVLGRTNHIFETLRAWLSVVGMVMLSIELAMFIAFASADNKPLEFLHYWQCIEMVVVSAYFGSRA